MKIGEWVVVGDCGLRPDFFGEYDLSFPTKSAAIASVCDSCMDARRTPKVKRLSRGKYLYSPKNCDDLRFHNDFLIVKLTAENLEHYKSLSNAEDEDECN